MITDLVPGATLDAAVAKACGITDVGDDGLPAYWPKLPPDIFESGVTCTVPIPFRPSIDLNAAFDAATKAHVFHKGSLTEWGDDWRVTEFINMAGDCRTVGKGSTPALAICAAILALKGEK